MKTQKQKAKERALLDAERCPACYAPLEIARHSDEAIWRLGDEKYQSRCSEPQYCGFRGPWGDSEDEATGFVARIGPDAFAPPAATGRARGDGAGATATEPGEVAL